MGTLGVDQTVEKDQKKGGRTSSHQFKVDVTGFQYPALEGGYGKKGRAGHSGITGRDRLRLSTDNGQPLV